jgi:hypothetical protein
MHLKIILRNFIFLFLVLSVNSMDAPNELAEKNAKSHFFQKVQGAASVFAGGALICDPIESAQFIAAEALFLSMINLSHFNDADLENEETKKKAMSHLLSAALNATAAYSILYGAAEYYFACDPKYI